MVLPRFIIFMLMLAIPSVAYADMLPTNPCAHNAEVITGLSGPHYAYAAVWDAAYGKRDREVQLFSAAPIPGGSVLAMGRALDKKTLRPTATLFAVINRRGKVDSERAYPVRGWELPVKMVATGKNFAVISDLRRDGGAAPDAARVAWYDASGKFLHERVFRDPGVGVESTSIIAADDKGGLLAVLHGVRRRPAEDYTIVARMSAGGAILWKRAYRSGANNMMMTAIGAGDGSFLLGGRIQADDGRPAAWLMRLDGQGNVVSQRTYARGAGAIVRGAVAAGGGFVVVGDVHAGGGGPAAAWIMAIDGSGDPIWQRYYRRGDMAFVGASVLGHADGRVTMLVNATALDTKEKSHIRLMTLSPLGVLLGDEAYIKGDGVRGYDMATGWDGERVVTASADMGRESENGLQFQGWILVATALDRWSDLCAANPRP